MKVRVDVRMRVGVSARVEVKVRVMLRVRIGIKLRVRSSRCDVRSDPESGPLEKIASLPGLAGKPRRRHQVIYCMRVPMHP